MRGKQRVSLPSAGTERSDGKNILKAKSGSSEEDSKTDSSQEETSETNPPVGAFPNYPFSDFLS